MVLFPNQVSIDQITGTQPINNLPPMTVQTSSTTIGIDIVSIQRIENLMHKYPKKFREFVYTDGEQNYCDNRPHPAQHYAAFWAVKEAYIKSLNIVNVNPDPTSIEIIHNPYPELNLVDDGIKILSKFAKLRDSNPDQITIDISLSHELETDIAIGIVLVNF